MGNDGRPLSSCANHAGGILGGISTGQPIVARFAVKPTSSILSAAPRNDRQAAGADTEILTKGRHDPCVGIRAVPVGEAMMAMRAGRPGPAPSRAKRLGHFHLKRRTPHSARY